MRLSLTVSAMALLTAVASMTVATTAPAHAAGVPIYTCDRTGGSGHVGIGGGNCVPSNGAAASGTLTYPQFDIIRSDDKEFLICVAINGTSGVADTPARVTGYDCTLFT